MKYIINIIVTIVLGAFYIKTVIFIWDKSEFIQWIGVFVCAGLAALYYRFISRKDK